MKSSINQTSLFPTEETTTTHPARYVGANNGKRNDLDFYPTAPSLVTPMLDFLPRFPDCVWEPACGDGAISKVLWERGQVVVSTDLNDYGYGTAGRDFFSHPSPPACRSIITNPPYEVKTARGKFRVEHWIEHAWTYMPEIEVMALLLRTTAIAGKKRSLVMQQCNLKWMLQFRGRPDCFGETMIDFAWFVFERGYTDYPRIHWLEEAK